MKAGEEVGFGKWVRRIVPYGCAYLFCSCMMIAGFLFGFVHKSKRQQHLITICIEQSNYGGYLHSDYCPDSKCRYK